MDDLTLSPPHSKPTLTSPYPRDEVFGYCVRIDDNGGGSGGGGLGGTGGSGSGSGGGAGVSGGALVSGGMANGSSGAGGSGVSLESAHPALSLEGTASVGGGGGGSGGVGHEYAQESSVEMAGMLAADSGGAGRRLVEGSAEPSLRTRGWN